ncbi:NAD(P)/FAD-dependent oxidoreductase [Croceiramulus getboli]|nr:NAD(P)/FAD-dependent oxidoreductase [Flavobacteriaceae bacterium YJPT1-3]
MNTAPFDIQIPKSDKPRLVVVGGGFAGINLIKQLKNGPFQIVLLDRHNYHTFQPMLYQVATSGLDADSIAEPFRRIFNNYEDFHFRMLKVIKINTKVNEIETLIGTLRYDYLVLACGTRPNFFGNKSIEKHATPLKSITNALDLRSQFWQCLEKSNMTKDKARKKASLTFTIVGGGPTGVEVAGALAEMRDHILTKDYPDLDINLIRIILIQSGSKLVKGMSGKSSTNTKQYLEKLEVELKLNTRVSDYDGRSAILDTGEEIHTETLVWAAGVRPNSIEGLDANLTEKGRCLVDNRLRVGKLANVFAIGDIALLKTKKFPNGLPGVAQVAIQQGRYLGKILKALYQKQSFEHFTYFDKGMMATVGRHKAVIDTAGDFHIKGFLAWLLWGMVHIYYLIGFRNKLLTFSSWVQSYFTYDRGTRLIIRPYLPASSEDGRQFIKQNEIGI